MDNQSIHSEDVKDMLSVITDGFLFESFAQEFLSARMGYKFQASGGIKDRGIDGFEHASELEEKATSIFQITIDKKPEQKLEDTLKGASKYWQNCQKRGFQFNATTEFDLGSHACPARGCFLS